MKQQLHMNKQKRESSASEGTSIYNIEPANNTESERISENKADSESEHQGYQTPWEIQKPVETKSREDEMEEYLEELLL